MGYSVGSYDVKYDILFLKQNCIKRTFPKISLKQIFFFQQQKILENNKCQH